MNKALLSFVLFFSSSCAIGPLVNHETARTIGATKQELSVGYGLAGYVFKWNVGINEDFDLGVHLESLSLGVRAKYAFLNSPSGWSYSGAFGIGTSLGGSHHYADLNASYLSGKVEPYGTLRLVHVKNDPLEFRDKNTGQVDLVISRSEYDYAQFIFGTRYWHSPKNYFSLEAGTFSSISSGLRIGSGLLFSVAAGGRF